ncbi:mediator of RNA polymerase II transcription subunit 14 [Condylostylus longicornis]|uniref:mediator of RNA polymerase II transcription subunit 14 n=1 Tax=Condylostylus longicornis TaxID=2530218 RepID=UPI00244DE18F|nr:mediator of RNA polymerase II transcription subunit 14 [Condylostylus longicornis]
MPPQPHELVAANAGGFIKEVPRSNSISLAMLIDFIIQKTYHDLTVLAELLPRKTDMERKIEIYNFSARTRQLFIRLLALVKWANSASKVDKSAHIMSFLDKQSMLFIETADMLARMSRETLVRARLPNFQIPAAIEILTTGTYNRLPAIIREKLVPSDPITVLEKKQTLLRLNQVIRHRLVTKKLFPQMRKFKIKSGRVTFHVDHEFEVSLTVMGDGGTVPWRLLDIDILVEDKETGDGKALIHSLQVNYIHQLIQSRLVENQNALEEVYNCLHYFCQSLQLEVLYTQTLRLIMDRLDDNIKIDEYVPGSKLTVSYWRELSKHDPKSELGYRLTISTDPNETARPLAVIHIPSIGAKESSEVADRAVRSDHLSMERLLVHTVYIRSVGRLNDLKLEFQAFLKDVDFHLQGTPAVLTIPVLNPCLRAEQIHITVDTHTGMLKSHVPKHLDCPIMTELQSSLNGNRSKLPQLVSELRFWITHKRCEKTLQHLPAVAVENLTFLNTPNNSLLQQGRQKIFVKLHRHPNVILVVQLKEKDNSPSEMEYIFHLGFIKTLASETEQAEEKSNRTPNTSSGEVPKMYVEILQLIELDTFVATHGPGTYIEDLPLHKRKSNSADSGPPSKQAKTIFPAYIIPELAHVVAMCDEKIPFLTLAREFSKRGIPHSGLQIESNATSLVLKLLTLPLPTEFPLPAEQTSASQKNIQTSIPPIEKHVWKDMLKRLLSVSIRSQINKINQNRTWMVEFVFYSTPLPSTNHKEQGCRRTVYLTYDQSTNGCAKTVDELLKDWAKIVFLYTLVYDFAALYKTEKYNLHNMVNIKSYSYKNLLMSYGPNKEVICNIYWSSQTRGFKMTFVGGASAINAHSMMREQLQSHLNRHYNLATIVNILHETYQPLSSIAKLPQIPQLGVPRPNIPVLSFCILPQSPTLLRLAYQGFYCLEIRFRAGGLVSIRDGAYHRFDRSHVVDEFTPTQGLKGFLSKYVDENAVYRRRSQSEDDNPPSPMQMEESHNPGGSSPFLNSSMRGPQSPRDGGLRFPAPITPPSISNPHTPASPAHPMGGGSSTGPGSVGGGNQSNHPSFNSMTSPPAPHMPHPSPGGGLMPASPLNPSPMTAHSPGPNSLSYMQGHTDSPFAAMSPATSNWPGSPSMPRPSPRPGQSPDNKSQAIPTPHFNRVLPARSWAGAVPTLLTHEALETLCRPSPHPNKDVSCADMSPLERFLGCAFIRRLLQRNINQEDALTAINSNEPGVVLFKINNLQYQVHLNPTHMQTLHLKVSPIMPPAPSPDGKPPTQWNPEDIQILEQFFEHRVALPPYRPNAVAGFCKAVNVPPAVLKDFIQIMRLELMPELTQGMKWAVQFCMRVPPSAGQIVPIGHPAVMFGRPKILFFLQITRIPYPNMDWKDSPNLVLPMLYDISSNLTQLAERREVLSLNSNAVNMQLRRYAEYAVQHNQHGECTLFPAVRDLLTNLVLPNDAPPPAQSNQIGGTMGGNAIAPSPVQMGNSPGQMIHSPMQMGQVSTGANQGYQMGSNQGPN